jgi:hypothetical protein
LYKENKEENIPHRKKKKEEKKKTKKRKKERKKGYNRICWDRHQ